MKTRGFALQLRKNLLSSDLMSVITHVAKQKFQSTILTRYASNKRDLPWRETVDPYAIMVSEVMSQQTQVSRVIPKRHQWMYDFPTIDALAQATLMDVLAHWSGLGYNRRGKALWDAGKQILMDMESMHPVAIWMFGSASKKLVITSEPSSKNARCSVQEKTAPCAQAVVEYLRTLPGIGEYTASAIAAFAYNMDIAVVDINVTRVLRHTFQLPAGMSSSDFRELATSCIPQGKSRERHNALMDYGALVLHGKATGITSAKQSKFAGSDREVRGWVMKQVTRGHNVSTMSVAEQFPEKDVIDIVSGLVRDGMVTLDAMGQIGIIS